MRESSLRSVARVALDESQLGSPQNRISRMAKNAAIFGISTTIDLAESKLFRTARTFVFEGKTKRLEKELESALISRELHKDGGVNVQDKETQKTIDNLQIKIIRDSLRIHKAVETGVEFAEEVLSDELLIKEGGTKLLNSLAGTDGKEYVKGTADAISNYANAVMQVFFNDRWIGFMDKDGNPKQFMGMYLAEKSMNFINPFNVEATLRILSDIPVINKVVLPVKQVADAFLEHSPIAKWTNVTFAKLLFGFHVRNSMDKAINQTVTKMENN